MAMSQFTKLILARQCQLCGFSTKRNFVLSASFSQKFETIQQIKEKMMKIAGVHQRDFDPKLQQKNNSWKKLPKSQDEIPVRTMKESYETVIVPLSSNSALRDLYISNLGHVRLGRLMEDMDLFAGYVSFKHCFFPNITPEEGVPIAIVTVSVSQIDFLEEVKTHVDVRISGHVCWVGQTSLEVVVWLHQDIGGNLKKITRALFLMAARNIHNMGPAIVNAIRAETPGEEKLHKGGEERKIRRQKMLKESLLNNIPTQEEISLIHSIFISTLDPQNLFMENRILPPNSKWMNDTMLTTLIYCHPENRNLHNKVFGGFLMRQALELSWIIGFMHSMNVPKLVRISDIGFFNSIDVGSIVKMTGTITYTEGDYIQIFMTAESYSLAKPQGTGAIIFNFTYKLGKSINHVVPSTYLEAVKYLDGRRRYKNVIHFHDQKQ